MEGREGLSRCLMDAGEQRQRDEQVLEFGFHKVYRIGLVLRMGEGNLLVFNGFRDFRDEKRSFRRENPSLRESTPELNAGVPELRELTPELRHPPPSLRETTPEVRPAGTELRRSRAELRPTGTGTVPCSLWELRIRETANWATNDARQILISRIFNE